MLGREVHIPWPPQRIISLVPSQTELLADMDLEAQVVGITKFCVHPERWFRGKTRIGGTKNIHLDQIQALQPDLIIANKEENEKEQIEALAACCSVWISDIYTIPDALRMIREVGIITDREVQAARIVQQVEKGFAALQQAAVPKKVAYFIWRDPWMCVGRDTFIHDMLERIGWQNVFADKDRYPEISPEALIASSPELVLLSSEPYPFREKHVSELQTILPNARIVLADGEMFSWYGSRMIQATAYLQRFIKAD